MKRLCVGDRWSLVSAVSSGAQFVLTGQISVGQFHVFGHCCCTVNAPRVADWAVRLVTASHLSEMEFMLIDPPPASVRTARSQDRYSTRSVLFPSSPWVPIQLSANACRRICRSAQFIFLMIFFRVGILLSCFPPGHVG